MNTYSIFVLRKERLEIKIHAESEQEALEIYQEGDYQLLDSDIIEEEITNIDKWEILT